MRPEEIEAQSLSLEERIALLEHLRPIKEENKPRSIFYFIKNLFKKNKNKCGYCLAYSQASYTRNNHSGWCSRKDSHHYGCPRRVTSKSCEKAALNY